MRMRHKNGFGLVSVLLIVSIAALVVIEITEYAVQNQRLANYQKNDLAQFYLLDQAAAQLVLAHLQSDNLELDGVNIDEQMGNPARWTICSQRYPQAARIVITADYDWDRARWYNINWRLMTGAD